MKKITRLIRNSSMFLALPFLFLAGSTYAATTANDGTHVMIMTHLCDSSIKTVQDFEAMENNKTPLENLGNDVLHCPTTALPGDLAVTGTVASPRTVYDFSVQSRNGTTVTLKNNGEFEQHKACESDLGVDVNMNGTVSSSTCLDISHYKLHVPDGGGTIVNVKETMAPAGFHFGIIRFTPVVLDGNNDSESLSSIDSSTGRVDLNVTPDKNGMVMLHIYQFMNSSTTSNTDTTGNTGTTTGNTTDNQSFHNFLNDLQVQINKLREQILLILNQRGNGNGHDSGNGNGSTTQTTLGIPHVVAASPSAVAGDSDDFAGDHFGANEQIQINNNGNTIMTVRTDKEGNFNTGSIYLPRNVGNTTYVFKGLSTGAQVSVTINVMPIH
ncbi:hypothetical protein H0W91_03335 [Patescibacteria group bacterium]|nr:hypothetical protein [Patescibacteria group bacterium]